MDIIVSEAKTGRCRSQKTEAESVSSRDGKTQCPAVLSKLAGTRLCEKLGGEKLTSQNKDLERG